MDKHERQKMILIFQTRPQKEVSMNDHEENQVQRRTFAQIRKTSVNYAFLQFTLTTPQI